MVTVAHSLDQRDPRCPALPAVNCFQSISGPVVHGIAASTAPAPSRPLAPLWRRACVEGNREDRPSTAHSHLELRWDAAAQQYLVDEKVRSQVAAARSMLPGAPQTQIKMEEFCGRPGGGVLRSIFFVAYVGAGGLDGPLDRHCPRFHGVGAICLWFQESQCDGVQLFVGAVGVHFGVVFSE